MSEYIEITYEIEDGYVGGSRPQHLKIDPLDFEDFSDDEIREQLSNQIHEDMLQTVTQSYDEGDIIQQIKDSLIQLHKEESEK